MQVHIPSHAEDTVKRQASAAGYASVDEYLLSLVEQDGQHRGYADSIANDPRVEGVARRGIESGPAVPLDMDAIRVAFRARLANQ